MKIFYFARSVINLFLFLMIWSISAVFVILFSFFPFKKKAQNLVIYIWGIVTCFLFNIKVVVENKNKNDPHHKILKGSILVFNHSSGIDILALCVSFPFLRFGAKSDLFKIPLIGSGLRAIGTLPIHREVKEKVIETYDNSIFRLHQGESFALAAEGKRIYNETDLPPFKTGPLVFATKAKVPIVPVVIKGAYECLPSNGVLVNKDRRGGIVTVTILEPIETSGYTFEDRKKIKEILYQRMNNEWKR